MRLFRDVCLLLLIVLFGSMIHVSEPDNAIQRGDIYFDLMRYRDAIAWYNLDSSNAEAQWKIARANICYGEIALQDEKEYYFRAAGKAAQRCVVLEPANNNGYTWRAAALGNIAMYEGSAGRVRSCNSIKADVLKAIQLNPNDDVAYSILGSLYREIGNISWIEKQLAITFIGKIPEGGYIESEQSFNRAIAIKHNVMRHWYELGLLYSYWKKDQQARSAFEKAKSCPLLIASDKNKLIDIEQRLAEK